MPISQPYIPKPAHKWASISREEIEQAMEAYFANGGKIQYLQVKGDDNGGSRKVNINRGCLGWPDEEWEEEVVFEV